MFKRKFMDKRTLLFVVALSLALFGVNYYFNEQHEQELKVWNEQQKVKKEQTLNQLKQEIRSHAISLSALPTVELYKDHEGKELIGHGIKSGEAILTLSENLNLPDEAFVKKDQEMIKVSRLKKDFPSSLVIYNSSEKGTLRVAKLPEFGEYYLELVSFNPDKIFLGSYSDGNLTLLSQKTFELERELSHQNIPEPSFPPSTIAFFKIDGEWLPAALFEPKTHRLTFLNEMEKLPIVAVSPIGKVVPSNSQRGEEKFFVLENDYQQLVFSNFGGALKEINLPFKSQKDSTSVVREIEFDRDMVKQQPQNALFPAHAFFTPGKKPEGPFEMHEKGSLGGYYPLIRRDLIQKPPYKGIQIPPRYYALNIISEFPEVAEMVYEVKSFTKNQIVFEAEASHRKITKIYSIEEESKGGPYCIDLMLKIDGDARGLWITSGIPEVEWISGGPAPALKYRITRNGKPNVENVDLPKEAITVSSIVPDWLCNSNGFFGVILDALSEVGSGYRVQTVPGETVPSRLVEIDQQYQVYDPAKMPGYMMLLPLKQTGGTMKFRIFSGPFSEAILKQVDKTYSDPARGYNPDYIACQTFHGWFSFISEPFARFLFFLMKLFYALTGSWGISIILLTVALKVMLYPLNAWSLKSTIKMQKIAPEIKAIQERYKKDPKKAQIEIVNLYRDRNINPLSGCLPLLIQMPFLIGMFDLLKSTFELRGASFIPGWIDDLSAPDVLFTWNYPIYFIGNEFHLLPFLLGAVMFLQQRMMSPPSTEEMTEQQRQQKAMGNIMTLVFTLMFYNFPSGLNIYWLSSMLLQILQQWWTTAKMPLDTNTKVIKAEPKGAKK